MFIALLLLLCSRAPALSGEFLDGDLARKAEQYCDKVALLGRHDAWNFRFRQILRGAVVGSNATDPDDELNLRPCGSVDETCNGRRNYGVCLRRGSGQEVRLGDALPRIQVFQNRVLFGFTGEACNRTHNYSVVAHVKCDARHQFLAQSVSRPNSCELHLSLLSSSVCFRRTPDCFYNDDTKHYDLTHLSGHRNNHVVEINSTLTVILNVCRTIAPEGTFGECQPGTAVCLIDRTDPYRVSYKSLGLLQDHTRIRSIEDGNLRIEYEAEENCSAQRPSVKTRSSITFVCDENENEAFLEYFVGVESCAWEFIWRTPSACNQRAPRIKRTSMELSCPLVRRDETLEKLVRLSESYTAHGPDGSQWTFYTSVCRSLHPDHFRICPFGAGICMVSQGSSYGQVNQEISLGISDPLPQQSANGTTILTFSNGSQCKEHPDRSLSSRIEFKCDKSVEQGRPEFERYTDCVYYFQWKTRAGCGLANATLNAETCVVWSAPGVAWDLTELRNTGVHKVQSKRASKTYSVSVCGGVDGQVCDGSFVCDEKLRYEKRLEVQSDQEKKMFRFNVNDGNTCENGSRVRKLTLDIKCDQSAGVGAPVLLWEQSCRAHFEWETNVVCKPVEESPRWFCPLTWDGDLQELVDDEIPWYCDFPLAYGLIFFSIMYIVLGLGQIIVMVNKCYHCLKGDLLEQDGIMDVESNRRTFVRPRPRPQPQFVPQSILVNAQRNAEVNERESTQRNADTNAAPGVSPNAGPSAEASVGNAENERSTAPVNVQVGTQTLEENKSIKCRCKLCRKKYSKEGENAESTGKFKVPVKKDIKKITFRCKRCRRKYALYFKADDDVKAIVRANISAECKRCSRSCTLYTIVEALVETDEESNPEIVKCRKNFSVPNDEESTAESDLNLSDEVCINSTVNIERNMELVEFQRCYAEEANLLILQRKNRYFVEAGVETIECKRDYMAVAEASLKAVESRKDSADEADVESNADDTDSHKKRSIPYYAAKEDTKSSVEAPTSRREYEGEADVESNADPIESRKEYVVEVDVEAQPKTAKPKKDVAESDADTDSEATICRKDYVVEVDVEANLEAMERRKYYTVEPDLETSKETAAQPDIESIVEANTESETEVNVEAEAESETEANVEADVHAKKVKFKF